MPKSLRFCLKKKQLWLGSFVFSGEKKKKKSMSFVLVFKIAIKLQKMVISNSCHIRPNSDILGLSAD